MRVFVGITGASGAIYALRLLEILRQHDCETWVSATHWGLHTLRTEAGAGIEQLRALSDRVLDYTDMNSAPASGSGGFEGVAVIPATVSTVSKIAGGIGDNLITRAAGVALKERARLVLVVRETPISALHLRAMTLIAEAGGIIMPASPGFYAKPRGIEELVDFIAMRAARSLGLDIDLPKLPEAE